MNRGDKQKDYGRLFELFGCELQRNGSNNAQATECPFCGKSKFSVNVKTGQYQCFSKILRQDRQRLQVD